MVETNPHATRRANHEPDQAAYRILTGESATADHDALYQTALNAVNNRGWSVVPIWGDLRPGQEAKAAAVSWNVFQKRLANPDEIREWWLERGLPGIAVVCGDISGVVVLDCDSPEVAAEFSAELPELTQTYTVLSAAKQLPHYYFKLPTNESLGFRGKKGTLELRGNGHYVVTYPTTINRNPYQLKRGGEPLRLTVDQYERLLAFVARYTNETSDKTPPNYLSELATTSQNAQQQLINLFYRTTRVRGSRNAGLFVAACTARDNGWQQSAVLAVLCTAFVNHPQVTNHVRETPSQRDTEAHKTVASAFSRPTRISNTPNTTLKPLQLPNAIREYLMQSKRVNEARLLDGLYIFGCQPGHVLSGADLAKIGAVYHIGKGTVHGILAVQNDATALRLVCLPETQGAVVTDGLDFATGGDAPLLVAYVTENVFSPELHSNNGRWTYCVCQGAKPDLNGRGRKITRYYRIPAPAKLCELWGLQDRGGDILSPADLNSAKAYRQTLTEALIKRKPGQYSKRWLADRVGVSSRRTIDSYTKRNPAITVTPQISRHPLTFAYLGTLDGLDLDDMWGQWLEDRSGKRYPPRRQIAEKHLKSGNSLWHCRQLCNRYEPAEPMPAKLEKTA